MRLYNVVVIYDDGKHVIRDFLSYAQAIGVLEGIKNDNQVQFVTLLDSDYRAGATSSRPGVKSPLHDHEGNPED